MTLKIKFDFIIRIFILILFTNLFQIGCGVNRYKRAEIFLNRNENRAALKEYLGLIKSSKQRKTYPDTQAMVGAAIAYRNLGKHKACMQMCRKVIKYKPKNAAALYYLGASLEEMGMDKLATKFYKQYTVVPRDDPYYTFLKAKMNILKLKKKHAN